MGNGESIRNFAECRPKENSTSPQVTPDGSSEVIYSLKHDNKGGCATQLPSHGTTTVSLTLKNQLRSKNDGNDKVFLLGGGATYWTTGDPHAHVEAYDETGHLGSLPDMLQPRWVLKKVKVSRQST